MGRTQVESRVETLPYSWYTDPEVARIERDQIFRRSWQYVGHLGELDGPGSMFPTQVGGLPLVVVLDREEKLRGFLNVCRHRGTVLVNEPQRRGTIQCPYHAWTYALDGSLRGAPRSKEEPDFDMDCLGLVPA
jgi:phenylpropionate dioxygenase-like ring-hydroxylating dioxygenase large terminal subunit